MFLEKKNCYQGVVFTARSKRKLPDVQPNDARPKGVRYTSSKAMPCIRIQGLADSNHLCYRNNRLDKGIENNDQ